MRSRSRSRSVPEEAASYWISFSDLATALLLAFVLILVSTLLQHHQQERATRKQLEALVGVRESLITRLRQEFKNEHQSVRVDERTGALELPSKILFAYNRAELTQQGRSYLAGFFRRYVGVLLAHREIRKHVAQIDIEGHADRDGSYLSNMQLTQARALAVCNFLFDPAQSRLSKTQLELLRPLVSVNGRSNVDPIYRDLPAGKPRQVDPDRSRRVTFKFRLKDEQLIQHLKQLLRR